MDKALRVGSLAALAALAALVAFSLHGATTAAAQEPTCVTLCQEKVDACASDCEALADQVYRDPASLRECQLACARQLFAACVARCGETGEVVADDYGIVAEHPDQLPPADEKGR